MNAKQLRQMMPKNALDERAARELVSLGPNVIGPVVPDMLRRLKDNKSSVANIYCEFFATQGDHFVGAIHEFLVRSSMPEIKNIIVTKILVHWSRDALSELSSTLQSLMTHTDHFNTDLVIIGLLQKHNLADRKWLLDWLDFKRHRLAELLNEANRVRVSFEN